MDIKTKFSEKLNIHIKYIKYKGLIYIGTSAHGFTVYDEQEEYIFTVPENDIILNADPMEILYKNVGKYKIYKQTFKPTKEGFTLLNEINRLFKGNDFVILTSLPNLTAYGDKFPMLVCGKLHPKYARCVASEKRILYNEFTTKL